MANNRIILKRTNTAGRTPNTTGSYVTNSQFISAGELALNMADGILYSSNGSAVIEVGGNTTSQRITNSLNLDNNKPITFKTVNTAAAASFIQQNDDNFVFYTTNSTYGQRAVWSIFANNNTANLKIATQTTFNGNVDLNIVAVYANGSPGTSGQVLTTNGTSTYWSTVAGGGVNTAAQYTWTNTQTFQANVSFTGNGIGISSNTGAIYLGGLADNNWKIGRNTGSTTKWRYTNNSIDIITANSNLEGFAIGLISGNSYFETGYLGTFVAANLTIGNTSSNSTINSTAFSGSANNASFLGGIAAASYVNSAQLSANLSNYQTTAGLSANVATLTANNTSFVGSVSASNVVSNAQLSANLANYQTTAGLSANVATLAANSATFLGGAGNFGNSTGIYTSGIVNAVSFTAGTLIANNSILRSPSTLTVVGGGATAEGGQIVLGYGNNLATTITGQANNTFNIDVIGGNTGSVPQLRIFAQHNDGTTTAVLNAANTGRVHIGSTSEQTDSTFKVSGTANISSNFNVVGITTLSANVGIGTSSPAERLHVNSGAAEFAVQWDSTGSNSWVLGSASNRAYIRNKTSGAEVLTILNGGNVGIGTTTAAQALQVNSSIRATLGGTNSIAEIRGGNQDGAVIQLFRAGNTSQFAGFSQFQGSLFIKNVDTGPVVFTTTTSDTERMRITSAGDVGIGNTAPDARLAVTGTANISGNVAIGGVTTFNANIILGSSGLSSNGSFGTAGHVLHSNGSATYWAADDNSGGTVTSVATGNGMTGGSITTTGTVSVLANTGIVANSTGTFVNATYIGTISSNNASFLGGIAAASYVNSAQLSANLSNYQTTAGLSDNVATLTANNTSFVGSVTAANVVSNAQLSGNLANYAALSGATFTGAVVISNNLTVTGNLTLSGNTLIVGANNLVVSDAIISLHTPANLASLTSNDGKNIGLAFHYYDTEDKHALLYRDNSTGRLQYHNDGSDPLTNSNPTGNNLGVIQANSFWSGNNSVFATTNSTVYTGTANNASFLGGTAAASYVQNTDSRTLSGNLTFSGITTFSGNVVVGNTSANSQVFQRSSNATVNVVSISTTASPTGGSPTNSLSKITTQSTGRYVETRIQSGASQGLIEAYATNDNNQIYSSITASAVSSGTAAGPALLDVQYQNNITFKYSRIRVHTANNQSYIEIEKDGTSFNTVESNQIRVLDAGGANSIINTTAVSTSNSVIYGGGRITLVSNAGIVANGSLGTAGQVLHSNGSSAYWADDDQGVTSVATGSGLTGGTITTTGTVSVLANTGIVANTTGLYVNATYIGTLSANNSTFLNSLSSNNYTQRYSIPNTVASPGWIRLGTLATAQDGRHVVIRIIAGAGYNAQIAQNAETVIRFKTSNGGSNTAGFFGDGYAYRSGNITAPSTVRVVQLSTTSYEFWGNFAAYTGEGAFYEVACNGSTWTHSGTNNGATEPTGTTTDLTIYTPIHSGLANAGIIANSTGIYVNSAYINTISSNSATFANSSVTNTFTVGTAAYFIANGNLGIGTSGPGNKLTVQKAAGASVGGEAYFTDGTYWTQLNSRSGVGNYNPLVQAGDHTLIYSDGTSNTGALVIGQWSSDPRGIRIDASGNVGIGVASAGHRLQVTGGYIAQQQTDGSMARISLINTNRNWSLSNYGTAFSPTGSFHIADETAGLVRFSIDSGGNTGIGVASPNARLQVVGTANISGAVAIGGITTFSANVVLGSSGVSANGGFGTAGQILTSNGSATYWATATASVNTAAQFAWTNTHVFTSNVTIGNSTTNNNSLLISQIGISNPNSFTGGTLTTVNSLNTLIVGPYTVASGNTLNIVAGSRIVII